MRTFRHPGSRGDMIWSLPAVMLLGGGEYHIHWKYLKDMTTLLESQPYVFGVKQRGKKSTYTLDHYVKIALKYPGKHLMDCCLHPMGLTFDRRSPWLFDIQPMHVNDIIVSVTRRYCDPPDVLRARGFDLNALKGRKFVFAGLPEEATTFKHFYPELEFEHVLFKDALEFARAIAGSRFFIGNQSLGWAIAEGIKHPRTLAYSSQWPNCMPAGPHGHTVLNNVILNAYMKNLKWNEALEERETKTVAQTDMYMMTHNPVDYFDFIIDLGANIGSASLLARQMNPSAKIIAVEPQTGPMKECLRANLEGLNVALEDKALYHTAGEKMHFYKTSYSVDSQFLPAATDKTTDTVDTTDLFELYNKYKLHGKGMIKMDIEGGEQCLYGGKFDAIIRDIDMLAWEVHFKAPGVSEGRADYFPDYETVDKWVKSFSRTHEILYHKSNKNRGYGHCIMRKKGTVIADRCY